MRDDETAPEDFDALHCGQLVPALPTEACPGEGRCHGPASWCGSCGDVEHVCDDPRCDTHDRRGELAEYVELARQETDEAWRKFRDASKAQEEAVERLHEYTRDRNARMTPRRE